MTNTLQIGLFFGLLLFGIFLSLISYLTYKYKEKRKTQKEKAKNDFWDKLLSLLVFALSILVVASVISGILIFF